MSERARLERSNIEAFILAGGRSRRMGTEKARLRFDRTPLVLALAERIAPAVARVRVVCKPGASFADLGLACIEDATAEPALVHGLRAALAAPGCEWRWVLACDMPDIDARILEHLCEAVRRAGAPGSAPRLPERAAPEPLPSLWHRDLLNAVRPQWGYTARAWVEAAALALWDVPPEEAGRFVNVNTPASWQAYQAARTGGVG